MTDVQRFRQSGYDGSLMPSTSEGDAHYMYYKDHAAVVALLREQLTKAEDRLELVNKQYDRLLNIIEKGNQ